MSTPFGFKGSFLRELWRVAAPLESDQATGVGLGVQSVLLSDAQAFARYPEAVGNGMMFLMTRLCPGTGQGKDLQYTGGTFRGASAKDPRPGVSACGKPGSAGQLCLKRPRPGGQCRLVALSQEKGLAPFRT
jgi:hypothetical protein